MERINRKTSFYLINIFNNLFCVAKKPNLNIQIFEFLYMHIEINVERYRIYIECIFISTILYAYTIKLTLRYKNTYNA